MSRDAYYAARKNDPEWRAKRIESLKAYRMSELGTAHRRAYKAANKEKIARQNRESYLRRKAKDPTFAAKKRADNAAYVAARRQGRETDKEKNARHNAAQRAAIEAHKAFKLRPVAAWEKPKDADGPFLLLAGYPADWRTG